MYEKEVEQLQNIIDDSKESYSSEEQGFLQRAIFRISEVQTGYINKSINIRRSRS